MVHPLILAGCKPSSVPTTRVPESRHHSGPVKQKPLISSCDENIFQFFSLKPRHSPAFSLSPSAVISSDVHELLKVRKESCCLEHISPTPLLFLFICGVFLIRVVLTPVRHCVWTQEHLLKAWPGR